MSEPTAERCYSTPDHVFVREVGDEIVLLNTLTETYHGLDGIGRRCFEQLSAGRSINQVAARLSGEFDVSVETLSRDLSSLVDELVEADLLRTV